MPIPPDVLAQLNGTRGHLGAWLPTVYSTQKLIEWSVLWRQSTAIGRVVAAEELATAEQAEHESQLEAERREAAEAESRHRLQEQLTAEEQYRLPVGSQVIVSASQTFLDGRLGTVRTMEFVGDRLMAEVMVDPLPSDHPLQKRDLRHRPLRFMPVLHRCFASELRSSALVPADVGYGQQIG